MKTMKFLIFIIGAILILVSPLFSIIYGSVSGTVIDEDTGKGVPGVYVNVQGRLNLSTMTDKDGKYLIQSLIPARYTIFVEPLFPYCSFSQESIVIEPGKDFNFNGTVKLAGTIRGKVVSGNTNKPLPGVSIMAWGYMGGVALMETGEDGTYFLGVNNGRLCPSSNYYIRARCKDTTIAYKYILGVNVEKSTETKAPDIVFDLNDPTGIEGYITSSIDGKPLPGVQIDINCSDKYYPASKYSVTMGEVVTNSIGYFSIKNLEPGKYWVFVYPPLKNEINDEEKEKLCQTVENIRIVTGEKKRMNFVLNVLASDIYIFENRDIYE